MRVKRHCRRRMLAYAALVGCARLAIAAEVPANARQALPPGFDSTVQQVLKDWSVPGMAVAIVHAGQRPIIRTYGLRQWNRPQPVTARSLFGIASVTKTFIAAGVGLLVQDGKVGWDDPIVRHLPEFRLIDPWITREVTIRDLLSHRSGFATFGDFIEEVPNLGEAEAMRLLAHYPQSIPFRSGAEYNSLGFIVLGQLIERVSGMPWSRFLHERLWRPLQMPDTYGHSDEFIPPANVLPTGDGWSESLPTGLDAVPAGMDVAAPHVQWEAAFGGRIVYDRRELENRTVHFHRTAIDPSQAAFTSVADLASWASVLLGSRQEDKEEPLQSATVHAMRELVAVRRGSWPLNWASVLDDPYSDLRPVGYGLGTEIYAYRGRTLVGHSGGELGYSTLMLADPYAGLAVVVIANNLTRSSGFTRSIMQTVLDWHYRQPATDWSRHYLDAAERRHRENLRQREQLNTARPSDRRTRPLEHYAAHYRNPMFGSLWVKALRGRLIATTGPSYEIELDAWSNDVFRGTVISPLRLGVFATFEPDPRGSARAVTLEYLEMPGKRLRFERVEADQASRYDPRQ